MDYSLQSLNEAFNTCYYEKNNTYKLYAILLATSLDKDFVLEYLTYFNDLHHLTGKEVLVIGPQPVYLNLIDDDNDSNLNNSLQYLNSNSNPDERLKIEKSFLKFLNKQTKESYELANFLSIDKSIMPAMVFFERLNSPHDFLLWPLNNLNGKDFVLEFRKILENLRTACKWNLDEEIKGLDLALAALKNTNSFIWPRDLSPELIGEFRDYSKNQEELAKNKIPYFFYLNLNCLVQEFNTLKDGDPKIPFLEVDKSITKLAGGYIDQEYFNHIQNWAKRWKSKIPKPLFEAISKLNYPYNFVSNGSMTISEKHVAEKYNQALGLIKLSAEKFIPQIESELASKKQKKLEQQSSVLTILEKILQRKSTVFETGNIQNKILGKGYSEINHSPKKVFISYSHDSPSHKAKILELAQTLRGDGIDCWLDQFEENPEYGFTRWMYEQIVVSDYVLVVCTPSYKMKFEAIENKKSSGGNFEGHLILQELHDKGLKNMKFIPVVIDGTKSEDSIPLIFRPYRRYNISNEYSDLVQHILGIKKNIPNAVGRPKFN